MDNINHSQTHKKIMKMYYEKKITPIILKLLIININNIKK